MAFEYKMLGQMTFTFPVAWLLGSIAKWLASNKRPILDKELSLWGKRAERGHHHLKDYFLVLLLPLSYWGDFNKYKNPNGMGFWASGLYVLVRIGHLTANIGKNV